MSKSTPPSLPRPVRQRALRHGQRRGELVGVPDVEEHPLRQLARHALRLEVDDEQRLPPDELLRVLPLAFEAGEDTAGVIAEADGQLHELLRSRHIIHALNRAEADVERFAEPTAEPWASPAPA